MSSLFFFISSTFFFRNRSWWEKNKIFFFIKAFPNCKVAQLYSYLANFRIGTSFVKFWTSGWKFQSIFCSSFLELNWRDKSWVEWLEVSDDLFFLGAIATPQNLATFLSLDCLIRNAPWLIQIIWVLGIINCAFQWCLIGHFRIMHATISISVYEFMHKCSW